MNQEDKKRRFDPLGERTQLFCIGAIFIIFTILHLIGIFEKIEWIKDKLIDVIVMLLAFGFMVLSNMITNSRKKIVDDLMELNFQTLGVHVNIFQDVGDAYIYIIEKLRNAKSTIEDVTWGSYEGYRNKKEQKSYDTYIKTMEEVIKKGHITYKEISSLSTKHYFDRADNLISNYGYHLGYIDISLIKIPLMSFIIIDSKDVIIGFKKVEGVIQPSNIYISITDPNIVGFYKSYYNDLWNSATKIKESSSVNTKLLNEIRTQINKL